MTGVYKTLAYGHDRSDGTLIISLAKRDTKLERRAKEEREELEIQILHVDCLRHDVSAGGTVS